jgi:Circadian oscillating protein COP23
MKLHFLFPTLALPLIISANALVVEAQTTTRLKFFCGTSNGAPATFVQKGKNSIPIIRWASSDFAGAGWTPEKRCREVSQRFQNLHQTGQLKFLTTGSMNGQPVVCTSSKNNGPCQRLILTVRTGVDPVTTLNKLLNIRMGKGGVMNENGMNSNSQISIDFNKFIDEAFQEQAPLADDGKEPNNTALF